MRYRKLGRTGLKVSEIGFGAEWIGTMEQSDVNALAKRYVEAGVNIVDCWMADPAVRSSLGEALEPDRDKWIIQGHVGSTWQDGQYVRTRDMTVVPAAFEDLLARLRTDHVELGMIHYVDAVEEFEQIMDGPFFAYVQQLLDEGKIQHIGISTHNPDVAFKAVEDGRIEMLMFSVNPAFDLVPPTDDIEVFFGEYDETLAGMDPTRERLYADCAGPREEVEEVRSRDLELDHVEESLAHAVLRRTYRVRLRDLQVASAELSASNPHSLYSAQLSAVSQTLTAESPGMRAFSSPKNIRARFSAVDLNGIATVRIPFFSATAAISRSPALSVL